MSYQQRLSRLLGGRRFVWRGAGDGGGEPSPAFQSYAGVVSVGADGWTMEDEDATVVGWGTDQNRDGAGAPQNNYDRSDIVYVRRNGFSAPGVAAQPVDELRVLSRLRQPYSDDDLWTAVVDGKATATLSNFVYADDDVFDAAGVAGGIANASTRAYPKPIAAWLNHDRDDCTSASYVVRLAVAHAHARNGLPVAGVRFKATDGATTLTVDVSAQTAYRFPSGLYAPVYVATLDFSTLTDQAQVTVWAEIYPWVGEVFDISADADANPSPNLCPLKIFNDWQGALTRIFAYVDGVGAGAPQASSTEATALANPFATVEAAFAAIQALDGANVDRGVVKLKAGTHDLGNASASVTSGLRLPLVTRDPAASKAAVVLIQSANNSGYLPDHLKFSDITIGRSTSSNIYNFGSSVSDLGGAQMDYIKVFDGVTFDRRGFSFGSAFMARIGRVFYFGCDGENCGQHVGFSSSAPAVSAMHGCSGAFVEDGGLCYAAIANDSFGVAVDGEFNTAPPGFTAPAKNGPFFGFNRLSLYESSGHIVAVSGEAGPRGAAVVGNVLESWGGSISAGLWLAADNSTVNIENLVVQMNTAVGQRVNAMYGEVGANKSGYELGGLYLAWNCKSDVFKLDGAATGNWPWRFAVGRRHVVVLDGAANGDGSVFNSSEWIGDVLPPASIGNLGGVDAAGFVDDQSTGGGNAGGGDYTPTAANLVGYELPADVVPFSHDLLGAALPLDGSALPGAVQIPS